MAIFAVRMREFTSVRRSKLVRAAGAILTIFVFSLSLFSQANQGTIQGGVFDQTGGAIAGATLTILDVARGVSRTLTADNAGQYVASNLTPSTYTVRAEAKGFRTVEHANILVEVGQNIRVDVVLQPGEQTQTVTVTSEAPAIDTTDSTLGGAVSNSTINSLPLNGRNFQRLLELRPGVVSSVGEGSGANSTNGLRRGDDLYLVEGLAQWNPTGGASLLNNAYRAGDSSSLLPIDAIQEFNTEQNPKAEYGWRDGSVIDVGVKSGTNSLHGTAYAFGRDSAWDSPNYFSGVTPIALEQFGATAGGRIVKDKLFWFVGYEGLRYTVGDAATPTIPVDAAMPASLDPNNQLSMVNACNALTAAKKAINPLSAQLAGLNPATCAVTPGSSTFENVFPFTTAASAAIQGFNPGLNSTVPINNGLVKLDYAISPKQHLDGMFFIAQQNESLVYDSGQIEPQWTGLVPAKTRSYDATWTWTPTSSWVNELRGGYAYIYYATLAGDANLLPSNPWPNGYSMNTGVTNPLYGGFPQVQIGGFSGYLGAGKRTSIQGPAGTVDIVDNVSRVFGKHAFKFGFEFVDSIFDGNTYNQANGFVRFADLQSFLTGSPKGGAIAVGDATQIVRNYDYAAFFQDDWRVATRVTLNLGLRWEYAGAPFERFNYIGDFNPAANPLTTPAVQQAGPGAPIPSMYNADKTSFSPRVGVAWDVRGNGKTVVRAGGSLLNAVQPTGDIVDTAPFGANFPSIGVNTSNTAVNVHTPETFSVSPKQMNWNLTGPPIFPGNAALGYNNQTYTGATCAPANLPVTAGTPSPCFTVTLAPNFRIPFTAEWNLDIQRAITNNLAVDVAYVGDHGFDEPSRVDIDQPALGAGWTPAAIGNCIAGKGCSADPNAEAAALAYPQFPYMNEINQQGNLFYSNYNSLQVTVNEKTSHGLQFLAGYTYSHALDFINGVGWGGPGATIPSTTYNVGLNYGTSGNDIRHRFTLASTYAVPGIKSPAQLLEGWQLNSIITLQSGQAWYPIDTTSDILGTGEVNNAGAPAAQTWNYTGPTSAFTAGPQAIPCYGAIPGCVSKVIPAACATAAVAPYAGNSQLQALALAALNSKGMGCYMQGGGILTPPAFGMIGNASKNLFLGPAYYNWDLSVAKDWKLKERYTAEFRAEFFNVLNRADFAIPHTIDPERGGQFGCACSTLDAAGTNSVLGSGGPRAIQLGLKLIF